MIVKCKECNKEYELKNNAVISNYQCECGGELKTFSVKEIMSKTKKELKEAHNSTDSDKTKSSKGIEKIGITTLFIIGSILGLLIFFPLGLFMIFVTIGYIFSSNKKNLIACPDCDHKVSKEAGTCPKCGRPLTS